jgi:hypothetical protein
VDILSLVEAQIERARDELQRLEAAKEALAGGGSKTVPPAPPAEKPVSRERRAAGRPLESEHPFPAALYQRGTTVSAWASAHGLERTTVRSWYSDGVAARKIPRRYAQIIEKAFGVRAIKSVWKNGIR